MKRKKCYLDNLKLENMCALSVVFIEEESPQG